jgi:hypothetical protein
MVISKRGAGYKNIIKKDRQRERDSFNTNDGEASFLFYVWYTAGAGRGPALDVSMSVAL